MTLAHEQYLLAYWAYHSSLLRKGPRGLHWGHYLFALGLLLTRMTTGGHWDRLH